ncbi:mitochondrial import inner membrane translocase subunit TIM23, putative (TIM23) [Babesia microti strain RI]|uniref:Mitochondrial import inner membrane translocase subunit TIM23, putative (TIM23) n=1 Tax=Babesia microti (strain RI) TaxID=1133968 RepID=A0A1R4AC73_BABMR|nr:mitochondrial import inner membrane translocase subunit TIM23, putative (TIM23) [Babesia microti strain RI]SJK86580.1 mitochondrial import inner membrane translocase subunit TIM23, putative (TIM23) [Babesia microti strain RI]|eukprot:XP_021338720.1 mitochondrial import inner membrane translocase subunit TIM23, putative (TIM23) [Babesia microti strain RI]
MDDYLSTGHVNNDLSIFKNRKNVRPLQIDRNLYLKGYGRHWGEKLTYSVGLAYGSGLLLGGSYGFFKGVIKGGATRRLYINSILNFCTTFGPKLGNSAACITFLYCGFNHIVKFARNDVDDALNPILAGGLSGAMYKVAKPWKTCLKFTVLNAASFSAIDYALKEWVF